MNAETIKKLLKYIAMFLITYLSIISVSGCVLSSHDILCICMLCTIGYGFLDLYYPSVYISQL
jgi:hypothetical protein